MISDADAIVDKGRSAAFMAKFIAEDLCAMGDELRVLAHGDPVLAAKAERIVNKARMLKRARDEKTRFMGGK